jgi:hypothetical protein
MFEPHLQYDGLVGFTAMLAFLAKFPVCAAIYLAVPKAHVEAPVSGSYLNV